MYSWQLQHDVALASHTTLEVGGQAQYYVRVTKLEWLPQLVAWARREKLPVYVLGGGSNLVVSDQGVSGLVLHLASVPKPDAAQLGAESLTLNTTAHDASLEISVAANVSWDDLVAASCAHGAYGLACLSGIPGSCGAAPVQNIGAYGQSLEDTLVGVDTIDLRSGEEQRFAASELGLAYRTSHFKAAWQGRYIITRLHLRLDMQTPFTPGYAQLSEALARSAKAVSPDAVRRCVLALRAGKSMVWAPGDDNRRSVGSFFTNPIVKTAHAQALCRRYAAMPSWPQGAYTKLSAAWLIEQSGFAKGFCHGRVGLSTRHTLALINRGGAVALNVVEFAHAIQRRVLAQFGVGLWPEPSFWGFGPSHPLPGSAHTNAWAPIEDGT